MRPWLIALGLLPLFGCVVTGIDLNHFQPLITVREAPARPITNYSLRNNTTQVGLAPMLAQVPSFDGKGELIASWTPHRDGTRNRPTFVIVHGGHGLVPTNFANAMWLRDTFAANVLVLDSYWSRGHDENWATRTPFGANMRVLDLIAAGRWLRDVHGTRPPRNLDTELGENLASRGERVEIARATHNHTDQWRGRGSDRAVGSSGHVHSGKGIGGPNGAAQTIKVTREGDGFQPGRDSRRPAPALAARQRTVAPCGWMRRRP